MHERLTVLDAALLTRERPSAPLHSGGVGIFDSGLRFAHVRDQLEARLGGLRHAYSKVEDVAPRLALPVWVDDAAFDLSYHLRHSSLPAPGDDGQLAELLARLLSRPLDRSRPLWEMHVIEGLQDGRVAVFRKVHLALGGPGATDPFALLLDETSAPVAPRPGPPLRPASPPTRGELTLEALRQTTATAAGAYLATLRTLASPAASLRFAGRLARDAAGLGGRLVAPPPGPLHGPLSPHRRVAVQTLALDDLRRVRRAHGGTLTDVIVTVVADAVGRLLRWRGEETRDLDLRAMVPVRVRAASSADTGLDALEAGQMAGEGVVGILAPLPVMELDPLARLYRVIGEFSQLKESRQAIAAQDLVRLAGFGPPGLHALAGRLVAGERRYDVAVSNAPGPSDPRYLAGVAMERNFPFLPLAGSARLSVALSSYRGRVGVGLLGDRDALPDLAALAELLMEAAADLVDAS